MVTSEEPLTVPLFKGTGWAELEIFIRTMRGIGWKESKRQDPVWMALRASLHFSGEALRWHAELPQDIRENWSKLEVAMIARWPPPDRAEDDVTTSTARAAAPAYLSSAGLDQNSISGEPKVVLDQSGTIFHLSDPDSEQGDRRLIADISRPSDRGVFSNENNRGSGQLASRMSTEFPSLESGSILNQFSNSQPIFGTPKPDPPKRPLTAFMFFSMDWRDRIKAENPEASFIQVGILLGSKWQELHDSEKTSWFEKANKEKARYEEEKARYEEEKARYEEEKARYEEEKARYEGEEESD